jgi:hypothetical protein
MTKKLTNLVKDEHLFKSREEEFSPAESKKRTEQIISYQRALKKSITIYPSNLQKVSFPSYPIGH